jgi:hypothetical protein
LSSKTSSIRSALGRLLNDQTPLLSILGERAKGLLRESPSQRHTGLCCRTPCIGGRKCGAVACGPCHITR